jgi:hypothetical protein
MIICSKKHKNYASGNKMLEKYHQIQGSHPHSAPGGGVFLKIGPKISNFDGEFCLARAPQRKTFGYYTWIHT